MKTSRSNVLLQEGGGSVCVYTLLMWASTVLYTHRCTGRHQSACVCVTGRPGQQQKTAARGKPGRFWCATDDDNHCLFFYFFYFQSEIPNFFFKTGKS